MTAAFAVRSRGIFPGKTPPIWCVPGAEAINVRVEIVPMIKILNVLSSVFRSAWRPVASLPEAVGYGPAWGVIERVAGRPGLRRDMEDSHPWAWGPARLLAAIVGFGVVLAAVVGGATIGGMCAMTACEATGLFMEPMETVVSHEVMASTDGGEVWVLVPAEVTSSTYLAPSRWALLALVPAFCLGAALGLWLALLLSTSLAVLGILPVSLSLAIADNLIAKVVRMTDRLRGVPIAGRR